MGPLRADRGDVPAADGRWSRPGSEGRSSSLNGSVAGSWRGTANSGRRWASIGETIPQGNAATTRARLRDGIHHPLGARLAGMDRVLCGARSSQLRRQPAVRELSALRHYSLERFGSDGLGKGAERHEGRIPRGFGIRFTAAPSNSVQ
jgi:hypothetical protein